MIAFSDLMRAARVEAGTIELDAGEDWLQGRSLFGGLQAAIGVRAMRSLVAASLPLRTLQMTFMAPVAAGTVRAQAAVLRTGRSTTHVEANLFEHDQRLATLIAVFGQARESRVHHAPQQPLIETAHVAPRLPWVEGITPAFTRHFRARWLRGGLPYSGDESRQTSVRVDLVDAGPTTELHLLAIADFIPPVALSLLKAPAPGSSLTWMIELPELDYSAMSLSGWRVDSEMVAAEAGYTSQSSRIWTPHGQLAALSRQSMVVFG